MQRAGHKSELLRFYLAFGRMLKTPSRYLYKDLQRLIAMHDDIAAITEGRRSSGRPRSPGGWSDLRGAPKRKEAHVHLCDHVCECDDPERPVCTNCQEDAEKLDEAKS